MCSCWLLLTGACMDQQSIFPFNLEDLSWWWHVRTCCCFLSFLLDLAQQRTSTHWNTESFISFVSMLQIFELHNTSLSPVPPCYLPECVTHPQVNCLFGGTAAPVPVFSPHFFLNIGRSFPGGFIGTVGDFMQDLFGCWPEQFALRRSLLLVT